MIWLALSPVGLLVLYTLYIQYERGGVWTVFKLFGIPGYPLDYAYNYVLCACLGTWPEKRTITIELPRLCLIPDLRGEVALALANFLNWIAPSGAHVRFDQ